MTGWLSRLPLFLVLLLGTGAAMILPAIHAAAVQDYPVMRSFLYSAILVICLTAFVGIVVSEANRRDIQQRDQLLILIGVFALLPAVAAVPFQNATQDTVFLDSYFEMVSSLTTTGASLVADPESLPMSLHLWRAQVGWMGGFATLVAAIAILAPMQLGGFELINTASRTSQGRSILQSAVQEGAAWRISHWARKLFPVYLGLTLLLWLALFVNGEGATIALCHAMSVLSTSGISPTGTLEASNPSFTVELLIFAFMLTALSRLTLMPDDPISQGKGLFWDSEFRLGLLIIALVSGLLFLHHWYAAADQSAATGDGQVFSALWGSAFTALSYLTTTGFVSTAWDSATLWSGIKVPGMVLIGLAVIGGGVATTAGGVKLLRVYTLYWQGRQEMDQLVYPSVVNRSGQKGRRVTLDGAQIAWVFFMLYAFSVTTVMLLLSWAGVNFEEATILTVSALSTTGPLGPEASGNPEIYTQLSPFGKYILAGTMVIGRLETLALIALFNRNFWRN